jgi:hypothetical protein
MQPHHFGESMNVRVSYRWRRTVDDEWTFGSITFVHKVDLRPDYTMPAPKRKPSAVKQEQDLQNRLYQAWEHLMRGALHSVRDYFKEGDGGKILETFQATVDSHTRGLNNYSTQFWRQQPCTLLPVRRSEGGNSAALTRRLCRTSRPGCRASSPCRRDCPGCRCPESAGRRSAGSPAMCRCA